MHVRPFKRRTLKKVYGVDNEQYDNGYHRHMKEHLPSFMAPPLRPTEQCDRCKHQDWHYHNHRKLGHQRDTGSESEQECSSQGWRIQVRVQCEKEKQVGERRRQVSVHHSSMPEHGGFEDVERYGEERRRLAEELPRVN